MDGLLGCFCGAIIQLYMVRSMLERICFFHQQVTPLSYGIDSLVCIYGHGKACRSVSRAGVKSAQLDNPPVQLPDALYHPSSGHN